MAGVMVMPSCLLLLLLLSPRDKRRGFSMLILSTDDMVTGWPGWLAGGN